MRSPTAPFAAAVVLAAVLAAGGCADLDAAAAAPDVPRDDMVSELATQLGAAATRTYSATYRLRGGDTALLAQEPARTALVYSGGRLITTGDAVTTCAASGRAVTCTVTSPPGVVPPGSSAPPGAAAPPRREAAGRALDPATLAAAADTGMVLPSTVLALLDTAALDTEVVADQHDTTIAGHHATCIDLRRVDGAPVSEFSACVTNDGALGSFTGTLAGTRVEVAMTRYADRADRDAFTVPPGARTVDRRGP